MEFNPPTRPGDIQSVSRALRLLEAIGRRGEIGVTEAAREVGLAVSTTQNLLRTLKRHSYLLSTNGQYRLGPAITGLAAHWDPTVALPALVQPELDKLSKTTGHAASATVVVGSEARLIGFTPGTGPVTITKPQWVHPVAFALPTGRLLVSMTRQHDWPEFIRAAEHLEPDWTTERWQAYLDQIARSGTCMRQPTCEQGQLAIAVPVWARGASVICAIGCTAPGFLANQTLAQTILDELWTSTTHLSSRLGCDNVPIPKPELPRFSRPTARDG